MSAWIDAIVKLMEQGGILILALAYLLGVITSLSPCTLSVLPVLVGYIGGSRGLTRGKGLMLSVAFVLGMSITLSILGLLASVFGQVFDSLGSGWYYVLAAVAIVMGLNLLDVIHIQFPTLKRMPTGSASIWGLIFMGMAFGLVMSPCTAPVLAVLLTFAAARGNPAESMMLLFLYGFGHGLILILAGTFTAVIKNLPALRQRTSLINRVSGVLLIMAGLYLLTLTW